MRDEKLEGRGSDTEPHFKGNFRLGEISMMSSER